MEFPNAVFLLARYYANPVVDIRKIKSEGIIADIDAIVKSDPSKYFINNDSQLYIKNAEIENLIIKYIELVGTA